MKTGWLQRVICFILAFVMVLGFAPVPAIAAESDGLCEHHTEHTASCGYSPAVDGHVCGHEHTDECYQSVTQCVHTHGDCGYVPAAEGHGCSCQPDESGEIVHTEGCGYVEAAAEVPCSHVCSAETGCITRELNCRHEHDSDCGYVEATQESPCSYQCSDCIEEDGVAATFALPRTASADSFSPLWPVRQSYYIRALDVYSGGSVHGGIDIINDGYPTQDVYAVADGTVVSVYNGCPHSSAGTGDECGQGWGNNIQIQHNVNGETYYSRYAHLTQNSIVVQVGSTVTAGQKIGNMGSSGSSTAPHLHLEITPSQYPSKAIRGQTFDYYINNTNLLSSHRMGFATGLASNSSRYGAWIQANCQKESDGYYYTGGGTVAAPAPPTNFVAEYVDDESARLSWSASAGATSYEVQYWSPTGSVWKTDSSYSSGTSYVSTGLKNYASWSFRVRAVNSAGSSDWVTYDYEKTHTHSFVIESEAAHPHKEYRKCYGCGYYEYTGNLITVDSCSQCNAVTCYSFDLNGLLDYAEEAGLGSFGTCDVYINGALVADDCSDYYSQSISQGSTYEIKDIRPSDGHNYAGVYAGQLSGTVNANTEVILRFFSNPKATLSQNTTDIVVEKYGAYITYSYTGDTAHGYGYTIESSNPAVATVSFRGDNAIAVYGVSVGTCKIVFQLVETDTNIILDTAECTVKVSREGDFGDGLKYTVTTDGHMTVSGTGAIPDYNMETSPWWDWHNEIKKLTIGEGITRIGWSAFLYCESLQEATLPDSLREIETSAFAFCTSLKEIVIPGGVETLNEAFCKCAALENVIISDGVQEIVGSFLYCTGLKTITIPESVTSITESAFGECSSLTDVYYAGSPKGWEAIAVGTGNDALTAATIHYGKEDTNPGGSCGEEMTWELENGVLTISGKGGMYSYLGFTSTSDPGPAPWYESRGEITQVVIEDGVVSIGANAFRDLENLCSVSIPESVASIGFSAFRNTGLRSVTIPSNDRLGIGQYAFFDCPSLQNATLPDTTQEISSYALGFRGNEHRPHLTDGFRITASRASEAYFYAKDNGIPVNVQGTYNPEYYDFGTMNTDKIIYAEGNNPNSRILGMIRQGESVYAYRHFFSDCEWGLVMGLKDADGNITWGNFTAQQLADETREPVRGWVRMEEGVPTPSGSCGNNITWKLEDGVLTISGTGHFLPDYYELPPEEMYADPAPWYAIRQEVSRIVIKEGITSIGSWAFHGCENAESVSISGSVTVIQRGAFSGCGSLVSVTIPDGVTEIDTLSFAHCTGLSSITIPASVDIIRSEAFSGCGALKDITFGHGLSDSLTIGESAFYLEAETPLDTGVFAPNAQGMNAAITGYDWDGSNRSVSFVGMNRMDLAGTELTSQTVVWIDGEACPVQRDEYGGAYVNIPENAHTMVTYTFNDPNAADVHTQYPTGMKVWVLKQEDGVYTAEYVPELDNLLRYSGSSIRIAGVKGIRMITSVDQNTRDALTGNGLAGFRLVEYGTLLAQTGKLGSDPLVLGGANVRSNYAYRRGVADPVFKRVDGLIQYTNVLVGFTQENCKEDIAMRPYIILEDEAGQTYTIYGGIVYRSVGYIAYQNRNAFAPGSAAYQYVWDIIHYVYGDQYDADYKG